MIVGSGTILALKGPAWWHETGVGHFFNSIHMWSVELFFFVMVVHLWGKYWMAAWRGGRTRVWITGAIMFLVAVPSALTGYVSQQNFDAQWISTQAKDGSTRSASARSSTSRTSGRCTATTCCCSRRGGRVGDAHVLLVRRNGVVPPFVLDPAAAAPNRPPRRPPSAPRRPRTEATMEPR